MSCVTLRIPLRNFLKRTKCYKYLGELLPTLILAPNSSTTSRKKVYPIQCFSIHCNWVHGLTLQKLSMISLLRISTRTRKKQRYQMTAQDLFFSMISVFIQGIRYSSSNSKKHRLHLWDPWGLPELTIEEMLNWSFCNIVPDLLQLRNPEIPIPRNMEVFIC